MESNSLESEKMGWPIVGGFWLFALKPHFPDPDAPDSGHQRGKIKRWRRAKKKV